MQGRYVMEVWPSFSGKPPQKFYSTDTIGLKLEIMSERREDQEVLIEWKVWFMWFWRVKWRTTKWLLLMEMKSKQNGLKCQTYSVFIPFALVDIQRFDFLFTVHRVAYSWLFKGDLWGTLRILGKEFCFVPVKPYQVTVTTPLRVLRAFSKHHPTLLGFKCMLPGVLL